MFRAVLTSRLQAAFTAAGIELPEGFSPNVVIASDTRYGDYQSNAAMVLAKQLKANPRALAQQIVDVHAPGVAATWCSRCSPSSCTTTC